MKLFNVATFGGNNTLYSRSEYLEDLIDRHARFTETLGVSVLLWRVLEAFFLNVHL